MAEPRPKSGPLQIHASYLFDRLLESKLAQAYDILAPWRERPVGGRVKEFDNEDGGDLRSGLVRSSTPWRAKNREQPGSACCLLCRLPLRVADQQWRSVDSLRRRHYLYRQDPTGR